MIKHFLKHKVDKQNQEQLNLMILNFINVLDFQNLKMKE